MTWKRYAHRALRWSVLACTAALAAPSIAEEEDAPAPVSRLPDVDVIGVTPLTGAGIPVDELPYNVQVTGPEQFRADGQATVYDFFERELPGSSSVDVQNNPYQRNFNYRGFVAGPLLGESVGIAAFVNGIRINEPFGDVIQSDLLPEMATDRLELGNANPAFGFNALGGALVLRTLNGMTYQGAEFSQSGGSFARLRTTARAGAESGAFNVFAAYQRDEENGWRDDSPSQLNRFFADVGVNNERGSAHINLALADTDLIGNGLAPVELHSVDREASFTVPDRTQNENLILSAHGDIRVGDGISVQANAYWRRLRRETLNGDEIDAEDCEGINFICGGDDDDDGEEEGEEEEALAVIVDQFGNPISSFSLANDNGAYGALNTSATESDGYGAALQVSMDAPLGEFDNSLIVGGGIDAGRTEFHSESGIGRMLSGSREVVPDPDGQPLYNTGILAVEADDFDADNVETDEIERAEVAPIALVAENTYLRVYLSDRLHVSEDLIVTASLAANHASIDLTDRTVFLNQPRSALTGSHDFFSVNPAIGATWDLPDLGVSVFGGVRQANRAPSPVELTCADPEDPCNLPNAFVADPPLEQVISRTVEAGVRSASGDLDWSASVFRSANHDDIIFVSAGVGLSSGYFRNIDETRRQGVEVSLAGEAGRFDWFANYSYVEATFQSSFRVNAENHPLAVDNEIPVEPGDRIPGIPAHSIGLGVGVEVIDGLRVRSNVIYRSGVHFRGDEGNLLDQTDDYAVVNVDASYRIGDWFELFGRIENLFDTRYETFGVLGETGDEVPIHQLPDGITDPRFISPGQPFAAMIGVRILLN